MKKFAKIFITLILAVLATLSLIACDEVNFTLKDEFKNSGSTTATVQGGFATEADDFYYVINGIGNSSSDNTFGVPVKGSLLAIKKGDATKGAVVVPKLLVSSDYNAGVYIIDGYAYFATTSTDKDLEGDVKNSQMVFARQKLDGTSYKEFLTVNSLSAQFRFIKTGNGVIVVYYDGSASALYSYNTKTGAKKEIIKTSSSQKESLANYTFFDNANLDKGIVAYTTTVYKGSKEEGFGVAEAFNKLYLYGVEGSSLIWDGANDNDSSSHLDTASISKIVNGKIIYTVTSSWSANSTKTYVYEDGVKAELIDKTKYDGAYLETADKFYTFDSEEKIIKEDDTEFAYMENDSVNKFLFKDGDYVYFVNSSSYLARIKADINEDVEFVEVLSDTSINTSWYSPVKIGDLIFYGDNVNGVKYVDVSKTLIEDKDDNENLTGYHFESQFKVSDCLTDYDTAVETMIKEISELSDKLDKNGKIFDETKTAVETARANYDALTSAQKKNVTNYDTLCEYEDAIVLSEICKDLEGVENELTDTVDKTKYQTAYDNATEEFKKIEKKGSSYLRNVCNLMEGNTYYWYDVAKTKIFKK